MKKAGLGILFTIICAITFAQAHTYNACCVYGKGNVMGECVCPGCKKEKEEKIKVSQQERKEQQEKAIAEKAKKELQLKNELEKKGALKKTENQKVVVDTKTDEKNATKVLTEEEKEAAKLEFQRKQKESVAKALEKEGDNFNALGSMFMDAALKKYQEAQEQYYNYAVQMKIDKILATKQAVTLVKDGMEKVGEFFDDTQSSLDKAGLPRWQVASFSYEGISPGFKGFGTQKVEVPQVISMSYGFYRIFAMEVGFNYEKSAVYKMGLEDNNNQYTGKDIEGSYTAVGPEVSIGLALGGKNLAVYGLYGFYFPFIIGATQYSTGYTSDGNFKDNFNEVSISKLKFGAFFTIPKTRIGIGVKYILHAVNGEKLISGSYGNLTDVNGQKYGIGPGSYSNTIDKLKYSSLAISFIIRSRR